MGGGKEDRSSVVQIFSPSGRGWAPISEPDRSMCCGYGSEYVLWPRPDEGQVAFLQIFILPQFHHMFHWLSLLGIINILKVKQP